MSDRMAERDRAKRVLAIRTGLYVALPLLNLALVGLLTGSLLWGLLGFTAGIVEAAVVSGFLRRSTP